MSSQEQQLNQDISELKKFVHDTRRQANNPQGNNYRKETLGQYYNLLNTSTQQLSQ
jgi:hypothetical protein